MAIAIDVTPGSGLTEAATPNGTATTELACNRPTAVVQGELMCAILRCRSTVNPNTMAAPAGWTTVYQNNAVNGSYNLHTLIALKQVGASEPADYTFTFGADNGQEYVSIVRITSHDTATPLDVAVVASDGYTTTPFDIIEPQLTGVTSGALLLHIASSRTSTGLATNSGYPTGTTGIYKKHLATNTNLCVALAYEIFAAGGATGTRTWSAFNSANTYTHAAMLAIRPATATAPTLTDVDTDETVTSTQTGVVFTGTAFGASQGASTLKLKHTASAVSITLSPSAWADTSITADIVRTQGGYTLPYGEITAEVDIQV